MLVECGDDNHYRQVPAAQLPYYFKPAHYGHLEVEKHQIRPEVFNFLKRLFAVFGQYEDYTVRFISNACCRAVKGLPIVLRQDIVFDYLYIKDLVKLTMWFIENDARQKAYNVCSGRPVAITELARMVAQISAQISGRNRI